MKEKETQQIFNLKDDLLKEVDYIRGLTETIRNKVRENGFTLKQIGISENGLFSLEQGIGEFKRTLSL
jgi:hypothetical protein